MVESISRRALLAAGLAGAASTAGCLGRFTPGGSGSRTLTYELTLTGSTPDPDLEISPAPDVEGVISIGVGDEVTLEVTNGLDAAFAVHNHVTDEETTVEAGDTATQSFEVIEAMVGRHELEGFVSDGEGEDGEGEHGDQATTLAVVEVRPAGG